MQVVFDAEANGFLDEVTDIHCVYLTELKGDRGWLFLDRMDELVGEYPGVVINPLSRLQAFLEGCTMMVCHNMIGYDLRLFKKLLGIDYTVGPDTVAGSKCTIIDSLVLSRVLNPDRVLPPGCPEVMYDPVNKKNKKVGPHGLQAWAYRTGGHKPTVDDWRGQPIDTYVERCIDDVNNNKAAYQMMVKEAGKHDWKRAMQIAFTTYHLMCMQEEQGVYFDIEKAEALLIVIDEMMLEVEREVEPELPMMNITKSKLKHPPKEPFKIDGTPSKHCLRYYGKVEEVEGVWIAVDHGIELPDDAPLVTQQEMKLSNQGPLKEWLLAEGWKPTLWNYKKITKLESQDPESPYYKKKPEDYAKNAKGERIRTSPKFKEQGKLCTNLELMQGPLVKSVVKWLSLRNRRSVIKSPKKKTGWLHHPRLLVDGKLPPASSGLTNTRRQKHLGVANVPKAKESVLLGKEMRDLFCASQGYTFVGYDASALEGRCEAHYTFPYDGGAYAEEILRGDIHTANCVAFGLLTQAEVDQVMIIKKKDESEMTPGDLKIYYKWQEARDGGGQFGAGAKSGKYCLVYGGGGAKLAMTLGKPEKYGKKAVDDYWASNIALCNLRDDKVREWKANKKKRQYVDAWGKSVGWIEGIDGGKILIRKEHSIINALFQNCGAMIMDVAGVFMQKWITQRGLDAHRVIFYHDEYIWECKEEDAELIGELGVQSIIAAGKYLGMNIELDAEAKIGSSWRHVH